MTLHNKSVLHKTGTAGKRNTKSADEIKMYKCDNCEFITKNKSNYLVHKLNKHSTKEERKKEYKYYCELCDFGVFGKSLYDTHLETSTHKNIIDVLKKSTF